MFSEHQHLIDQLKVRDYHFARIFAQHSALDQRIAHLAAKLLPGMETEMDRLKREKLQLKDEIWQLLQKAMQT